MAEQLAVNQWVVGSSPTSRAIKKAGDFSPAFLMISKKTRIEDSRDRNLGGPRLNTKT